MGVLTYKGAVAEEGTGATGDVARWIEENNIPRGGAGGAQLFAESGCTNCHTYLGSGVANLGAPDLSGGRKPNGRGAPGRTSPIRGSATR